MIKRLFTVKRFAYLLLRNCLLASSQRDSANFIKTDKSFTMRTYVCMYVRTGGPGFSRGLHRQDATLVESSLQCLQTQDARHESSSPCSEVTTFEQSYRLHTILRVDDIVRDCLPTILSSASSVTKGHRSSQITRASSTLLIQYLVNITSIIIIITVVILLVVVVIAITVV